MVFSSHILILLFFVRTFAVQTVAISSESMEDNLLVGDHILVDVVHSRKGSNMLERLLLPPRRLRRGMVVAFIPPNRKDRFFVKRIVGLPGEEIEFRGSRVLVNGVMLQEDYLSSRTRNDERHGFPRYRVPSGHFFCLGDNRSASNDSRYWGPLPRENIIGIPWRVYWSFRSKPDTYSCAGFVQHLRRMADYLTGFLHKTRWSRTYRRIQPDPDQSIFTVRMNLETNTAMTNNEK